MGEQGPQREDRTAQGKEISYQSMRPARPKAAAPPRILTVLEAAPLLLDLADEVEVEVGEVEAGEVADEAPGDVDVGGGIEEVRVTP